MIGKEMTAKEAYGKKLKEMEMLIERLKETLKAHAKDQELDPWNWSYVADLNFLTDHLDKVEKNLR